MTDPCGKGPDIDRLQVEQGKQGRKIDEQGVKIDQVLANQANTTRELKEAIDRLTRIIESDIETRKDVEQLKKDREILYEKSRKDGDRIEAIEMRNARCDGAGIFERWPILWDFYQTQHGKANQFNQVYNWYLGERGVRRFIPAAMAFICAVVAIMQYVWG